MLETSTPSRREQILQTATEMFASRGYKASSLRDLAAELGIEAPSLYSYINGKEDLLRQIILPIAERFMKSLEAVDKMTGSPSERFEKIVEQHISIVLDDIKASSVFWNDHRLLTGDERTSFYEMRDSYEKGFTQIIQEGVDSCEFEIEDIHITSMTLLTALNNIWHWHNPSYTNKADLTRQITITFLNGIRTKSKDQ